MASRLAIPQTEGHKDGLRLETLAGMDSHDSDGIGCRDRDRFLVERIVPILKELPGVTTVRTHILARAIQ